MARVDEVRAAARTLLAALPHHERLCVLRQLLDEECPVSAPHAGPVLVAVAALFAERAEWTVAELRARLAADGVAAPSKDLYNAVTYLARRGSVRRLGYGRYVASNRSTDE